MQGSSRRAGAALVAALALAACSSHDQAGEVRADYPSYASLDELASASTVVARLTVSSSVRESTVPMAGHDVPHKLRAATVTDALAGDLAAGQTIDLIRPGTPAEPMQGMRDVEPSTDYLLFLEVHPDGREAEVVGGDEGIFEPVMGSTSFRSPKFGTVSAAALQSALRRAHP
ncbi:hypothetical protein [Luteipulveratus halotolerans]|uniref:SAF domain-containing protein n=1 Tax=Luteipulveratus halotolerans TaxID=1631356 RepID=A0A0L6CGD2_9MICO|nr:hypothetical protein [Luteipulveratus halotolerans]KNX36779.1 hypothetical protein VV01_05855 [Luteipulveratus halotolerans]